jgi:RraA family protein
MAAGFRIFPLPPKLSDDEVAAFRQCAASHLADSMGRLQAAGQKMVPRHKSAHKLCGCAVTVRTAPGDNLLVQKALDMARPGDVIVVDGGGYLGQALVGEIMGSLAQRRAIAGFVVDGAVRDLDFIAVNSLPVYSTGVSPRGPSRSGPGEINGPVTIAGMVVFPGDIIVGDVDGVVAVPRADAAQVLRAAQLLCEKESAMLAAIARGDLDRSWIDAALRSAGCEFFDPPEGATGL